MSDRARAMVEHLAMKVCGLKIMTAIDWHNAGAPAGVLVAVYPGGALYYAVERCNASQPWNPLADTTTGKGQAMEVWEQARELGVRVIIAGDMDEWEGEVYPEGGWIGCILHTDSASRAICEAIALATGWEAGPEPLP